MKKNIILLIFSCLLMPNAWAAIDDEFDYEYEGNTLTYIVTDDANNYVSVLGGSISNSTLIIPEKVQDENGTEFSVTAIAEDAFGLDEEISSLIVLAKNITIYDDAFYKCINLTSIVFQEDVEYVGDAFYKCSNLTSIVFQEDVEYVGDAWGRCSSLSNIVFNKRVYSIYDDAFSSLDNITYFEIGEGTPPTSPKGDPFIDFSEDSIINITFVIPDGLINNYIQAWQSPENPKLNIYEKSENKFFKEGFLYQITDNVAKEVSILNLLNGTFAEEELNIADNVAHKNGNQYKITSIEADAFLEKHVTSLTFGSNIRTIGSNAFKNVTGVSGSTIEFPSSLQSIGSGAFLGVGAATYKFLSHTAPTLGGAVYDIFSPNSSSPTNDNDGSTQFVIPCGTNNDNAWESANNWSHTFFTNNFTIEGCQDLDISKSLEGNLGGIPDPKLENFGKIKYTHYFKAGVWETLYLPFAIDSMLIQGEDYKNAVWTSAADDGTAIFYLAKLIPGTNEFELASSIEPNTPYIIQVGQTDHASYYNTNPITFISAEDYNWIPNDWNQSTTSLTMYGNTTLQPKTITNAYYLGNNNSFELADTYTLNPFECYISPEKVNGVQNMQARRFSVRVRPQSDVTTGVPTVDSDQLFCQIVGNTLTIQTNGQPVNIYNINGMLIHSFAEGNEQVSIDLDNGCYIINSLGYTQKIIF